MLCETGWTALADEDPPLPSKPSGSGRAVYQEVGSPRGTGLALLGLAAVEAAEGRSERAVEIAGAAEALTERAGVVCDHPMDPGVIDRIEALKVSIRANRLRGSLKKRTKLSPAAVLAMSPNWKS